MNSTYEPIIPVDQLDMSCVKIVNDKFTYDNDSLGTCDLKILCERVPLYFHKEYESVYIQSNILSEIREKLEDIVKKYRISNQFVQEDNIEQLRKINKIRIHFTNSSKIKIIPTKTSGGQTYFIRDSDSFKTFVQSNKNNINLETNIIIKPKILKKSNYIWIEIYYGDVFHKSTPHTNKIYNKIYASPETNLNKTIIL